MTCTIPPIIFALSPSLSPPSLSLSLSPSSPPLPPSPHSPLYGVHYARPHSRHLRHVHGRHRRHRQGGGSPRHRFRPERLSTHEHAARGARHRAHAGFEAAQLEPAPDVVVVGNVMTRGMPVIEALLESGIPYTSGPEWLAREVLRDVHVLGVSGTHGKTTTSSMLAWILEHAGLEPGIPDRRRARQFLRQRAARRRENSSSSRRTNTTPRSSTSAPSSCTTVRAR